MADIIEKEIEEVFGIPSGPKQKEAEDETSFDEGVKEINDTIDDMDEITPVSKTEPKIIEEKEIKNIIDDSKDILASIPESDEDEIKVEEETISEDDSFGHDIPFEDLPEGEISWLTNVSSARFINFYKQKVSIIKDILRGKQMPFSKFEEELRKSYCDVRSSIYDLPQLHDNMSKVHKLRDRVCQIQTEINSQYFKFERIVELLRGLLARTQYERGKQEGVQFEHMRDVELYLESLKSVHKTADIIHKNLDAAFDLLSRQVTIATVNKSTGINGEINETSSSRPNETYINKEVPEELTGYDNLLSGGVTTKGQKIKKKPVQGIKPLNWDEMPNKSPY